MYICSHYCIGSSLSLSFYYIIGLGVGVPLVPGTGEVTVQDRIIRLVYCTYVYHEYFHVLCVYYIVLCVFLCTVVCVSMYCV